MATSSRTFLPEPLNAVLALRETSTTPPADVAAVLSSIPFFRRRGLAAPPPAAGPRFGALGGGGGGAARGGAGTDNGGGRFSGFRPAQRVSEDGFEVYTGGRRNNRGGGGRYAPPAAHYHHHSHAPAAPAPTPAPAAPVPASEVPTEVPVTENVVRFSSAALRASVDTEDRKLARVKGKINKMGFGTYDATKVFMEQILSSDDTDFLDELMKYIFSKASTEPAYCPLYAKFIHELGDEYPRFREVSQTIFRDYVTTFAEVDAGTEPDPSSSDYAAFKESQERKRARRGYSQFVAELTKLGEVDVPAFAALIQQIIGVIEMNSTNADKTLMGEEYIDCLANMCYSASSILGTTDWSKDLKRRVATLAGHTRKTAPGLSNKAIFALMDLNDFAERGWKQSV